MVTIYSNHLNTGLVWYSNGRFVSGCQMVVWNLDWKKPVYGQKCLVLFQWSTKSHDFTIWIPHTRTARYSGVRYSDGYCIILKLSFKKALHIENYLKKFLAKYLPDLWAVAPDCPCRPISSWGSRFASWCRRCIRHEFSALATTGTVMIWQNLEGRV